MTDEEITALLGTLGSPALRTIGGEVLCFRQERNEVEMVFEATAQMCHSRVIVQGGFITAMVDSAMAYAAMGACRGRMAVPTLEIKVSFLKAGNPGCLLAKARVVRLGRTIGFLDGELFQDDALIATATSTVRLIPKA
jgi:uncharacterized protein (TIGR00369 family)